MSRKFEGTKTWEATYCPSFKGLSCFVLPGAMYGSVVTMMASVGFTRAATPEEADLVVFVGGSDVSAEMYDQRDVACRGTDPKRDAYEKAVFEMCRRRSIPMFGICRGMQFLHAMNGGKLWQDVQGHAGPEHYIVDLDSDVRVFATSYHHQMVMDNDRLRVIAVTEQQISRAFVNPDLYINLKGDNQGHEIEIEAGAYDETNCFFVQGHPECGCDYYKSWTMHRLGDFLFNDVGVQIGESKDAAKKAAAEDEAMVKMIEEQIG